MSKKVAPDHLQIPLFSVHSDLQPRVFRSMREAINHAATGYGNQKALAAELDVSPSFLSMSTVLSGGDHVRTFPADLLVQLEAITSNLSPLYTHAALLGHEVRPRADVAVEALAKVAHLLPEIEALAAALKAVRS